MNNDVAKADQGVEPAIAIVLGMSIHGLAVCRALGRAGVRVIAFAAEEHPACHTKYAEVYTESVVNSDELTDFLCNYGAALGSVGKAVLFPTNDRMVRNIGENWSRLSQYFLISWSRTTDQVVSLLKKDSLPAIAEKISINHPVSATICDLSDVSQLTDRVGYPCIVKPVQPLSTFKVQRIEDESSLREFVRNHTHDLPLVAQTWIPGGDDNLVFYSAIWNQGSEVGFFTGRKHKSYPPAMGQGVILEGHDDSEVLALGRQFARHVNIDGPISIEFKKDSDGALFLIEPNVGRSEYCVDLLIQSGLNMPMIEFELSLEHNGQYQRSVATSHDRAWYDTERNPTAYALDCFRSRSFHPRGKTPIFPFVGQGDTVPIIWVVIRFVGQIARAILRRVRNIVRGRRSSSN